MCAVILLWLPEIHTLFLGFDILFTTQNLIDRHDYFKQYFSGLVGDILIKQDKVQLLKQKNNKLKEWKQLKGIHYGICLAYVAALQYEPTGTKKLQYRYCCVIEQNLHKIRLKFGEQN